MKCRKRLYKVLVIELLLILLAAGGSRWYVEAETGDSIHSCISGKQYSVTASSAPPYSARPSASLSPTPSVSPRPMATVSPTPTRRPSPTPAYVAIQSRLTVENISAKPVYKKSGYKYKSGVKLTWDSNGISKGYTVQRKTGEDGTYAIYGITEESLGDETIIYVDTSVKKGVTYYYRVCAFVINSGKEIVGDTSEEVEVTVGKKMMVPKITAQKKGKKLTITFKKAEGEGFQAQYQYLGQSRWTGMGNLKGRLKKSITRPLKANGFRLRMRTYMKVNGKRQYSAWSKAVVVR